MHVLVLFDTERASLALVQRRACFANDSLRIDDVDQRASASLAFVERQAQPGRSYEQRANDSLRIEEVDQRANDSLRIEEVDQRASASLGIEKRRA
jgi:hypothetical protein